MSWNPLPGGTLSQASAMPGGTPSSTAAAEVAVLRGKIHSMEQEVQSLRTQRDSVRTIQVENERLKNQIASLIETASKERAQALELQRAALATGPAVPPASFATSSQPSIPAGRSPRAQYSQVPLSRPYSVDNSRPMGGTQYLERPTQGIHTPPIPSSSSSSQLTRQPTRAVPSRGTSVKASRTISEASSRQPLSSPPVSERRLRFIERAAVALEECKKRNFREGILSVNKTDHLHFLMHSLQRGESPIGIDADCRAEILSLGKNSRQFLEILALLVPVDSELLDALPITALAGTLRYDSETIERLAARLIADGDGRSFFEPLRSGNEAGRVELLRLLCRVLRGTRGSCSESVVESLKRETDSQHSLLTLTSEFIDPAEVSIPSNTCLHVLYFLAAMAAEDSIEYVMSARPNSPGGGTRPNIACRVGLLAFQLALQEMEFRTLSRLPGSEIYHQYETGTPLRIDIFKAAVHLVALESSLLSSLAALCLQKRAAHTKGEIPAECEADCQGTSGTRCNCLASYFGKHRWVIISLLSTLRLIAKDPLGHTEPIQDFTTTLRYGLLKDLKFIKEWLRSNGEYELDTNLTLGYTDGKQVR